MIIYKLYSDAIVGGRVLSFVANCTDPIGLQAGRCLFSLTYSWNWAQSSVILELGTVWLILELGMDLDSDCPLTPGVPLG